jgi:hypothetical protein
MTIAVAERPEAFLERPRPPILAVEFKQIESEEKRLIVVSLAMQLLKTATPTPSQRCLAGGPRHAKNPQNGQSAQAGWSRRVNLLPHTYMRYPVPLENIACFAFDPCSRCFLSP